MSKPLNWVQLQDIRTAIDEIARELAAEPDFLAGGYSENAWKQRREYEQAMHDRLATLGLVILDNWNGGVVRMHGIRATSTSGVNGALRNWLTAARKRLPGQVAA